MEVGNKITLKSNGFFVEVWDKGDEVWIEKNIADLGNPFSRYLRNQVFVDENFTVEDLMTIIKPYQKEIEKLFQGSTYGFSLDPFYENLKEETEDKCEEVKKIEFHWISELYDNYLTDYISFHGIDITDQELSLELTPIKNFKHKKIYLNETYKIIDFEENKVIYESLKEITLYEFISGFLFELTYHGTPEKQLDYVNDFLENINKEDLISMDDLMLSKYELDLSEAIEEEKYEEAARIRKLITELKNKNEKDENDSTDS